MTSKKLSALALAAVMSLGVLSSCQDNGGAGAANDTGGTIKLWSFTDELPNMMPRFLDYYKNKNGKDFPYEIKTTIIATDGGGYQTALDQALASGGADAPDLYATEAAFVLKYTQGEAKKYALPYKELPGFENLNQQIKDAQIAQYTIDIGTRDGDIVGLGWQSTGAAVYFRRDIAKDVWGTDDPAVIGAKIGPGWDKFFEAAAELKAKGYPIVSGQGDIWKAIWNDPTVSHGWLVGGKLDIPTEFDNFFGYAKQLYDNGWSNLTSQWSDAWQADMEPSSKVFAFFGPAWLMTYVIASNHPTSSGLFGVCESPAPFFWGGTWNLVYKDTKVRNGVAEIIHWLTLDITEEGQQWHWANGTMPLDGSREPGATIASAVVMAKADGKTEYVGGQNIFDIFVPATANASAKNLGEYDESINALFDSEVTAYCEGNKTKEEAIAAFKANVKTELDIDEK